MLYISWVFFVKGRDFPDGGFIYSHSQERSEEGVECEGEIDNPEGILAQLLENKLHGDEAQDDKQSLAQQVIENVL